jgi:hypothetical protein
MAQAVLIVPVAIAISGLIWISTAAYATKSVRYT